MEVKKIKIEIELTEKEWLDLRYKLLNYAGACKSWAYGSAPLEENLASQIHKGLTGKRIKTYK